MMFFRTIVCVLCCLFAGQAALADDGMVVVAKGGDKPLLLWDATPVVTTIVSTKQPRAAALQDLESRAMQILGERAPSLRHAKSLTIRLIYQKTGAVSPVYGTATFEGIERLFELTASANDARSHAKQLADQLQHGSVPRGVDLNVTGKLPPP
ncbi:MAG: hypothetical protein JO018_01675 [Candidatus Eremiobacteraeota bacterium]|nr:hypothetical protein [Candidatus Eremiobacteraeota bacterium]MBV9402416.1 hypothetical protein [Candidatus Eremiobacteraeota bacterium]MBV9972798.1 hypothetical protein [Candidatus Eremiobacteraeota bacterium]